MATTQSRHVFIVLFTGSGKEITLNPSAGDPSMGDLLMPGQQEPVPVMSRNVCIEHAEGDEAGISWSMEIHDGDLLDGTTDDLVAMITRTGIYATDTTTDPGGQTWMLGVRVTIVDPSRGPRVHTFARTTAKAAFAAGSPSSKWTISGTAWGLTRS